MEYFSRDDVLTLVDYFYLINDDVRDCFDDDDDLLHAVKRLKAIADKEQTGVMVPRDALTNVVRYLYHDEEKDYKECGCPDDNHIFLSVDSLANCLCD
jgi:hypothetical protein